MCEDQYYSIRRWLCEQCSIFVKERQFNVAQLRREYLNGRHMRYAIVLPFESNIDRVFTSWRVSSLAIGEGKTVAIAIEEGTDRKFALTKECMVEDLVTDKEFFGYPLWPYFHPESFGIGKAYTFITTGKALDMPLFVDGVTFLQGIRASFDKKVQRKMDNLDACVG